MPALVLRSLADLANAVAALPVAGPLPVRTVLVSSERQAHALRRALVESGREGVLAGTRFTSAVALAEEVLHGAGTRFQPGEDGLRGARLLTLFDDPPPLEYFDPELLRSRPGWDEAFARTLSDLEGAGLRPDTLPVDRPQWRDVAAIWRRLEETAGTSFTAARILAEAAAVLRRGGAAPEGPALAVVTGHERAVHGAFLRALPGAALGIWAVRPLTDRFLQRVEALYGEQARRALELSPPSPAGAPSHELDLLQRHLFGSAADLADPSRPRSTGPDGTVHLEEHAGVEAEVEAAVDWVARQVLEHGTALQEVAVLTAQPGPVTALLAARIARLPFPGGPLPVYVAGGISTTATAAGARLLALLQALAGWLPAEAVAAVLPSLRAEQDGSNHLSHAEAIRVAFALGTAGGNAAHPQGALEWPVRAAAREAELETALAAAEENAQRVGGPAVREVREIQALLALVRAARPALEALGGLARLVYKGAPIGALLDALETFAGNFLLEPGTGPKVSQLLADSFDAARSDLLAKTLRGPDALRLIEDRLRGLSLAQGRFGAPAVFVGTVAEAAGLEFAAVRVVGLCEGALPSAVRQDPVLPDALRHGAAPLLPLAEDRALAQLHGLARVVAGTRSALALSAPRTGLDRGEREPASIFVEAGAALARPNAATGARGALVPGLKALRRDAFRPARADAAGFREVHPVVARAWLERAAAEGELHPSWRDEPALDLGRVAALSDLEAPPGPADGLLGESGAAPVMPGLTPEKPISASALGQLLGCPRRFLYGRVLHLDDPAAAPSMNELDALTYGTLFHGVMEAFFCAHGAAFAARGKSLERWQEVAGELADAHLDALLSEVPLAGEGIREKERNRLRDDVRSFLAYDREGAQGRAFVDVERPFGYDAPLALPAGERTLYVRGCIDRLDVQDGVTLLRDLKTGKPHPRTGDEAGPTAVRDVQLALYALVTKQLARKWGLPGKVQAAYAYAADRGERERAFREDVKALTDAGKGWLSLAAKLLATRTFPATTNSKGCTFCGFKPLCGGEAPERSGRILGQANGPAAAFYALENGTDQP
ncbi:PD-(D/E)XK nuclease family protein [Anaeromyxobacter paludicola]|uniref:PD-(D/E)XK endonuclease-like domain-containing protein n=1 Tax=Anaeromyxobacter paludicola TaxID=2918171 RepID=A0ABM7X9R8_9BACT|nr:PD-(D/E)XK nuclease family protein [Anaeromyxobacter paludicola]BDG08591.1 hypothetical protein AMPC_17040 [Anaeromyxobacter paludicola]